MDDDCVTENVYITIPANGENANGCVPFRQHEIRDFVRPLFIFFGISLIIVIVGFILYIKH